MPNPVPLDAPQLALTILIAGGIVAGTYEWIRYYLNRRREESVDMSKQKMTVVAASLPTYMQLGTYNSLSTLLRNSRRNQALILYYTCKILTLQNSIFERFGAIQLDNLEAEKVLTAFGYEIISEIGRDFPLLDRVIMANLTKEASYDEFIRRLGRYPEIPVRFFTWLSTTHLYYIHVV